MAKVYVSSTYADLKAYREAVSRTLRRMGHEPVAMEDYVATGLYPPLEKCLTDVAACDWYIGIFAWRYGYLPNEGKSQQKSITELEYRQAQQLGKPCFIFLLDEDAPWSRKQMDAVTGEGDSGRRIEQLRQELGKTKLVSFFKTPDELASLVSVAISRAQQEREQLRVTNHLRGASIYNFAPEGQGNTLVENKAKKSDSSNEEILEIWREKLAAYSREEAITADPEKKFQVKQLIKECQQKIQALGG